MNTKDRLVHLRGDTNEVLVPIHGKTTIEKGEPIFLAGSGSNIVGAPGDYYGYPATQLADVTKTYFDHNLVGIAMKGSESGTTEDIRVATTGIFRGRLYSSSGQDVKVGYSVAGTTHASGASISGTSLNCGPSHDYGRMGICVKSESGASYVDFMLMTRFSGVSIDKLGAT